ncbi:hypothetical protein ACFL0M_15905, partial [Thermodesulfobacteriota bacterium]
MTKVQNESMQEQASTRAREFSGLTAKLVTIIGSVFSLYHIAYSLDLFTMVRIIIDPGMHRPVSLLFTLVLVFILLPATKKSPRDKLSRYDVVFILTSLITCIYLILFYRELLFDYSYPSAAQQILAVLNIICILEAIRRSVGLFLTV